MNYKSFFFRSNIYQRFDSKEIIYKWDKIEELSKLLMVKKDTIEDDISIDQILAYLYSIVGSKDIDKIALLLKYRNQILHENIIIPFEKKKDVLIFATLLIDKLEQKILKSK